MHQGGFICQYKYDTETNTVSERTAEEIQADIPIIETPITWEDYALDFEFRLSIVEMTGGETILHTDYAKLL